MESPESWRWIWLVAAAVLAIGEMSSAGSFFLLPFALGAVIAAVLAFAGVDLAFQWAAFAVVSMATFAGFRPLAKRLDRNDSADGIGAKRLIGQEATVLEAIPAGGHDVGLIRIQREEWRAQSVGGGEIAEGTRVRVVEVTGTRVMVHPVVDDPASLPPN